MQERVAAEAAETRPQPAAPAPAQGSSSVQRVLALQRTAGNAAVAQLIARQELEWDPSLLPPDLTPPQMRPIQFVFILGAKDDAALETAEKHYRSALMQSPFRKVVSRHEMADPSLAGVFDYLAQIKYEIAEITLVVHGGDGDLIVPLNAADTDNRTTAAELSKALDDKVLTPLSDGQITEKTRIRLQACFGGAGKAGFVMTNLLDQAFGGEGTVLAPTVEVGYRKDVWKSEGLSGWWVVSDRELAPAEVAAALKAKYAASLGALDLGNYQDPKGPKPVGTQMKTDDEMWVEMGRTAMEDKVGGKYFYLSNAYTQSVKPGYEDDPVLYTKSAYGYRPKEL